MNIAQEGIKMYRIGFKTVNKNRPIRLKFTNENDATTFLEKLLVHKLLKEYSESKLI